MRFRSLRARFIVSSICWTGGLLFVAHMTSMVMIRGAISLHGHWILAILAVIFMIAGLAGVQRGFSPFKQLRERLSRVRDGSDRRLDGEYPNEVQPLVSDLNALLDDRERAVQRAQSTAGDLAHGLKTPLAVLAPIAPAGDTNTNRILPSDYITSTVLDLALPHVVCLIFCWTPRLKFMIAGNCVWPIRAVTFDAPIPIFAPCEICERLPCNTW